MSEIVWLVSSLLALSCLVLAFMAGRVLLRRKHYYQSEVNLFVLFTVLAGVWSLGSCFELLSPTLADKVFWSQVQYLSAVFLPLVWAFFLMRYTDVGRRFQRWVYIAFIPSLATLGVVWFKPDLMWSRIRLEPQPFPHAVFEHGGWFEAVHLPYSYGLLFLGFGVLTRALWTAAPGQRGQLWLLLWVQCVPVVANIIYLLKLTPFDLTAFGFSSSSLLLGFGLFRHNLMQQLPIAYRRVFEQMRDGVLVLDKDRNLLSFNDEGGKLLKLSREHLQQPLHEICPSLQGIFDELWQVRSLECCHGPVHLSFHLQDMHVKGVAQGYLLTVQDTSERKEQQVRLEHQAKELELLDRVRVVVANQLSLSQAMRTTVEAVADVFGYDLVSIYLLEEDMLVEQHQVGYTTLIEKIPLTRGVIGKVARTGQPALITNVAGEADFIEAVPGVISEVAVPLLSHGVVVGVLSLESTKILFTAADVKLMMALSEQIAIAVERAKLYEDVSRNEKQLRLLTENMNDMICLHAPDGTFTYVSPSSKPLFGFEPFELLGKSPSDYVHPDDLAYAQQQSSLLLLGKTPKPYLERGLKKDGSYLWIEIFSQPIFNEAGEVTSLVSVSHDVSERKKMEEQMLEGALLYDALTGLPNRVLFMDRLQQTSRRTRRATTTFAVMFLDLDRFKIVNDSLGHRAGDTLLVEVAKRIGSCIRAGDTAARLGGDEFAVLLENISEAEIKLLAERIQFVLRAPFNLEGHEVVTSVSIGIIVSSDGTDPEDLLRRADMAMYQSKSKGKARYTFFDEAMYAHLQDALRLENDLRRAVTKGEFVVSYQPIMQLDTQTLVGFEALVRWQHPERGLLLPGAFISSAEDMGLIGDIDVWVLREACQQLGIWQSASSQPLTMSVNVSAKSLLSADFSRQLGEVIAASKVEAGKVKLELTESVLMDSAAKEILTALRNQGVRLVIDDFGTGYSSLSYLHTLPLDALKIDRSFISRMDGSNLQIVNTIILLAQSLGLDVVAEGVETPAQLEKLQGLGCELGQGFLFGGAVRGQELGTKTPARTQHVLTKN